MTIGAAISTGASAGGGDATARAVVRVAAVRAWASIAAIRAAFRPCCRRSSPMSPRRCGRGCRERCRASLRGGRETVQLGVPFRQPRGEAGEPRARRPRLLDDPVVLAGRPADAVEAGDGLVERLGAEHDGERIAARLLVERAGEVRELALRCQQRLPRDRQLRPGGGLLACERRPPGARCRPARCAPGPAAPRASRARASPRRRAPPGSRNGPAAPPPATAASVASAASATGTDASSSKPVKTAAKRAASLVECAFTRRGP